MFNRPYISTITNNFFLGKVYFLLNQRYQLHNQIGYDQLLFITTLYCIEALRTKICDSPKIYSSPKIIILLDKINSNEIFLSNLIFFSLNYNCFNAVELTRMPGMYIYTYIIFTNPSARAGCDTRSIFKRSLAGLNSEFSFSQTSCLTKAEEPSLPYYLPIAGGRIIGFIPFPRVLVLCEMQLVSARI